MSEFIEKPETKENMVVRVKPSTIEFLSSQGPKSTVANKILEIAIANWDGFKKLSLEDVSKQGSFKRYSYGDFELDGLTLRSSHSLLSAGLKSKGDVRYYIKNIGELENIDGLGGISIDEIMDWLEA